MFSLGLVVDGSPIVGVTYDPFLDRLYWAVVGQGAFCNGARLNVSHEGLDTGTVAVASDVKEIQKSSPYLGRMIDKNVQMAVFSGAVYKMMLIAQGKIVGFVSTKVNAYDMAASQVIVTEAGGIVTNQTGDEYDYTKPFRGALVSNGASYAALKSLLVV
jgi:myo-inositol-1(or 4)-monophosphatase